MPLPIGGWHFTFFGSNANIRAKLQAYAHTEMDDPKWHADDILASVVAEGKDIFRRDTSNTQGMSMQYSAGVSMGPSDLFQHLVWALSAPALSSVSTLVRRPACRCCAVVVVLRDAGAAAR